MEKQIDPSNEDIERARAALSGTTRYSDIGTPSGADAIAEWSGGAVVRGTIDEVVGRVARAIRDARRFAVYEIERMRELARTQLSSEKSDLCRTCRRPERPPATGIDYTVCPRQHGLAFGDPDKAHRLACWEIGVHLRDMELQAYADIRDAAKRVMVSLDPSSSQPLRESEPEASRQLAELHGYVADLCSYLGNDPKDYPPDVWRLRDLVTKLKRRSVT